MYDDLNELIRQTIEWIGCIRRQKPRDSGEYPCHQVGLIQKMRKLESLRRSGHWYVGQIFLCCVIANIATLVKWKFLGNSAWDKSHDQFQVWVKVWLPRVLWRWLTKAPARFRAPQTQQIRLSEKYGRFIYEASLEAENMAPHVARRFPQNCIKFRWKGYLREVLYTISTSLTSQSPIQGPEYRNVALGKRRYCRLHRPSSRCDKTTR